ncbi:2-amino-4-hydroxy-6-hydroxymethyldihydropteridine diphosphokinase [Pseudoroseicyclus aestuarii]|uniref:2-amino-4-hydroxy-6-hydroxymethyldihydropteridine pyrophosphokinase n=1 Tax=Pseudoroseicyclus aestuarii TaxID=1795041 RepID=A0A318SWR4_9RHOB|nr:2-amino-4-hydroxy-6-hydroxymethyldihydropteridine diphosphokinase [Pseudoroseicyclus aestuarii]PYE84257.1 2-amino-4-hydroxy-6-hydroxymethyldihydropteridine diphosphokinase [Pseudoroseicyclus aestuarii]
MQQGTGGQDAGTIQHLVALGANAPSGSFAPEETLRHTLARITRDLGPIRASKLYRTKAFPAGSGPDFVNAALVLHSALPPAELLQALHGIEEGAGRKRTLRWGPRPLDLDLIASGAQVLPDAEGQALWRDLPPERQARETPGTLILPHPRLQDRAFVLVPLAEVAPDWRHPLLGLTPRQMLDRLPQEARDEVLPL